ncbi:MAG: hypothetical protein HYY99_01615 [Candidatus Colwellbacteria bacterium]|nr:hypothetical protein [Candidatus Colwellbacteria bacterium]
MDDFTPLIHALKYLLETGIIFIKALWGVVVEFFQLAVQFIKAGLSLLQK